jgi:hypothetical protein
MPTFARKEGLTRLKSPALKMTNNQQLFSVVGGHAEDRAKDKYGDLCGT